jgi:hypothetical protein
MKAKLKRLKNHYDLFIVNENNQIETWASTDNTFESKLSKKNCDEIFGIIDIEKLADEYCTHKPKNVKELRDVNLIKLGFRDGFNKAMELYQQPTEIDVEVEMREDYLMWKHSDIEKMSDCLVPKLDSNGYLILKKI